MMIFIECWSADGRYRTACVGQMLSFNLPQCIRIVNYRLFLVCMFTLKDIATCKASAVMTFTITMHIVP